VRDAFGSSDDELAALARESVRGSLAPDHVKVDLLAGVDVWLAPAG
jgi:adenosine deaminase